MNQHFFRTSKAGCEPCLGQLIIFTFMLFCSACSPKHYYSSSSSVHVYTLDMGYQGINREMDTFLATYDTLLKASMEDTLAINAQPLSKAQPESTLGNWLTDAAREVSKQYRINADVVMLNYAALANAYLHPGPIRRKDIYALLPYEISMMKMSIDGQTLRWICDTIAVVKGLPVSGLSFRIEQGKAKDIKVNNLPLNDHLVYTILLNDWLLRYGQFTALLANRKAEPTGIMFRNMIFRHLAALKAQSLPVKTSLDNRIYYAE